MTRNLLPDRRPSWTQKAKIGGQTFHLNFGEYLDGRLGEVFVDASKEGTFARGILSALGRVVSVALQSGTEPAEIVKVLRRLNFAPNGPVAGSPAVDDCTSIVDWIAREMEAAYCSKEAGTCQTTDMTQSSGK
jgi:ribonucleoside-diphosphate reductase alpha chain